MHRLLAVCLLVACCGPFGTSAVWLEGPPLKQPVPKAASAASEGFASPPESVHAAFVRPSASHEPHGQVVGGEESDEGGVTSQSAAGAHAEAELGGWRGVRGAFKAVSGLPELVAKLVEKGAQEELAAAQAEIEAKEEAKVAAAGRTRAAAGRERRGRAEPKGGPHRDSSSRHGEQDHPPSPVAAYHFSKDEVAADRLRAEAEPVAAALAAAAEKAAAAEERAAAGRAASLRRAEGRAAAAEAEAEAEAEEKEAAVAAAEAERARLQEAAAEAAEAEAAEEVAEAEAAPLGLGPGSVKKAASVPSGRAACTTLATLESTRASRLRA